MDYSYFWATNFFAQLLMLLLIYDIICQFWVNLAKRFNLLSSWLTLPTGMQLLYGIGQFHVHGHQQKCYARYSPNFIQGAGIQDGETLEPLWDPLNEISDSTRGMSTSHRREVIDDHMNYSNWAKTTRIGNDLPTPHWPNAADNIW